jgi:hypothetical protein
MMPFVIEHKDRQAVSDVAAKDPLGENVGRLRSFVHDGIIAVALVVFRLRREPVPIGDQHLAALYQRPPFRRHDIELGVVVAGLLWTEHLQAFLDREVWAANEDGARKLAALAVDAAVAERPRNEHRHHDGLPRTGRHLAADAPQRNQGRIARIINQCREKIRRAAECAGRARAGKELFQVVIRHGEALESGAARSSREAQFGEIDDRLDRLALTEEQSPMPVGPRPILQQVARDVARAAIADLAPAPHVIAQCV